MQPSPTYPLASIKKFIDVLTLEDISNLSAVIKTEKGLYPVEELQEIYGLLAQKIIDLWNGKNK